MPQGKGKEREASWDLFPTITYRHVLSNVPTVHNPLRVVALCDNDAFYASAERVRLGLGEDVPIVVQQWQALIAVSYPAREYGIKRMDNIVEAKKKCAELVPVHVATYHEGDTEPRYVDNPDPRTHKISLDYYRRESQKIVDIYREFLPPGGEIERASIDECFFCFTLPVRDILLQRYPYLAQVPPDAPQGLDTPLPKPSSSISWDGLGNIIPVTPVTVENGSEVAGPSSPTKVDREPNEGETEDPEPTWCDVALSIGAELMQKMRTAVKERLGYTTSAGVARNKVLAKLVASYKKRDQQSVLRNAAIPGYWRPMPFQNIRFLGGKLGETLSNEFEAQTVGELEYLSLEDMQRKFGEESIWVWHVLRGIDHTEVAEKGGIKSMGASKNLRPPLMKPEEGIQYIDLLSAELALRLKDAREITPTLWPKTLAVHMRQDSEPTRSKQCAFPYARSFSASTVSSVALKLWKELTAGKATDTKIIHIGLGFSGLVAAETGQKGIEGFLSTNSADRDVGGKKRRRSDTAKPEGGDVDEDVKIQDDETFFVCSQCSKRISLPRSLLEMSRSDPESAGIRKDALAALKMEHDDYHFAQNLAREGSDGEESGQGSVQKKNRSPLKKKKKKVASSKEGIAKYFGAPSSSSSSKK